MATIIWKSAAPSGTCRSRYKARRAAAVAQRRRDKLLLRKISQLLDPQAGMGIGGGMRQAFSAARACQQCGLPRQMESRYCSFCQPQAGGN